MNINKEGSSNNQIDQAAMSSGMSSPHIDVTSITDNSMMQTSSSSLTIQQQQQQQKRQYNKQNSMMKKQQKMLQMQLQQQLSQSDPASMAAAAALSMAAASQFANLFDPQQLLLQLQQLQSPVTPLSGDLGGISSNAPLNAMNSVFGGGGPSSSSKQTPINNHQILNQQQQNKARKISSNMNYDYLSKPQKKVDRRHTDPLVSFTSLLENILNELRELPEVIQKKNIFISKTKSSAESDTISNYRYLYFFIKKKFEFLRTQSIYLFFKS
jgi:hypothetical protein